MGNENMNVAEMAPLATIKDVSKLLSVSVITVRRLVATGELRCVRLSKGGPLRFDMADVQKFIASHKQ
jgi:excisionase family DNA binding protein